MDSIYIKKVLEGDTNAFRYFVSTYKNFAFSLSFSILKNEYLAEESIQEAFIKAFEKLNTFKQNSTFKTWFGRIVINESLHKSGNKKRQIINFEEIPEKDIKSIENSLNNVLKEEQKLYITMVFEKLSAKETLVLDLFYLKDRTIKDIQELTNWSQSKIKMLLVRGRTSFYSELKILLKKELKDIL